jgi:hypothetical protein
MQLSRTTISLSFALLALASVGGCGSDRPIRSRDAGEAGTAGDADRDAAGGAGGSAGADGAVDAGFLPDGGALDAAALPLPQPAGFTISSGGGRGSSVRFNLQVGIGAPIAVTRGAGESHRLSLGSPALEGVQRR